MEHGSTQLSAEGSGRRIRLNVSTQVSDEVLSRFLVVVDTEAGMEHLVDKVQRTLRRGGINSTVERVLNSMRAILPHDEFLGDMLRDGEEIIVVLRGADGMLMRNNAIQPGPLPASPSRGVAASVPIHSRPASAGGFVGAHAADVHASPGGHHEVSVRLREVPRVHDEDSEEEAAPVGTLAEYPPPPTLLPGALGRMQSVPGPKEIFDGELQVPHDILEVDHPSDAIQPVTYDNDWLVENLTPQLREFVLQNFHEEFITEPKYVSSIGKYVGPKFYQTSGSFVSIFMRPQNVLGSDPSHTCPVHYNIAKLDLARFRQEAEAQIERAQKHLTWFSAAMNGLQGLLQKGMSEHDHISDMLPHSYETVEEAREAMVEADRPLFPKIDGSCPIIIIDTSGPGMSSHLSYVKASIKRAIHAHIGSKRSFQLIRFAAAGGEPRLWMKGMVSPTFEAIHAAEEWLDNLTTVQSSRLIHALRYAVAHQECDQIYIVSSAGFCDKNDHDTVLSSIRQMNVREVRIDTVAVEPDMEGELLLRRIAESNHGDMMLRSDAPHGHHADAGGGWTSWRTNLVNERSKKLTDTFKKQKMSIGSQVRIIEVMQGEERKKEESWCEEWKCAQRLLDTAKSSSSKKHGTVMGDRDAVKEMERKAGYTRTARCGGGYQYKTDTHNIGLEHLFEHQSAVPWTAHTDTVACGPKMPTASAGHARTAKFPPSNEPLPEALKESGTEMPKQRVRPRSARGYPRQPTSPKKNNPWMPQTYGSGSGASFSGARRHPSGAPIGNTSHRGSRKPSAGTLPAIAGPGSGASIRAASADKAAGDRATSPTGTRKPLRARNHPTRSKDKVRPSSAKAATQPSAAPPPVAESLSPPQQRMRRWSF
jgi:hypothetical protein